MNMRKILSIFLSMFICFAINAQEVEKERIEKLIEEIEDLREELDELKESVAEKDKACKQYIANEKDKNTQSSEPEKTKEKKGEGKVILLSFVNFNYQSLAGETKVGFGLDRTYMGYEYKFNNGIRIKAVIDFGKPSTIDDYNYLAYIKNAFVSWTRKGFTINGGMIQTTQSALQEKIWAKRYIMMVFHDQYKFGSSADLGLSMEYKFADWVKADAIVVNGEGYKKLQKNKGLLYGLGFTFNPTKDLYLRVYADLNNSGLSGESNIYGYSALAAYKSEKFTLSGEFNMMQNYKNVKDHNLLGCSVYGSAKAHKLINVYARYDYITSNNKWNIDNDKQTVIAGFEIIPCKYVKLSPNFRMEIPRADGSNKYMGYLSCYFGL